MCKLTGESYDGKSHEILTEQKLLTLLIEKFGEHAHHIIFHYNQGSSSLLIEPFRLYYADTLDDRTQLGICVDPDNYIANIFSFEGKVLSELLSDHLNVNVPCPEKADQPYENWKLKIQLKVLSQVTENGFEIFGIGTDNTMIADMLLNKNDPCLQLEKLVNVVINIEKSLNKIFDEHSKRQKADSQTLDVEMKTVLDSG